MGCLHICKGPNKVVYVGWYTWVIKTVQCCGVLVHYIYEHLAFTYSTEPYLN